MNAAEQLNNTKNTKPKPLPLPKLPDVESFNPDMLPNAIKDYVLDVSDRQQSPPDFVAAVAMCAISAVIGRKFLMLPKQLDDWCVVPNLWGAIIGRPSAMKSPSMKEALKPLFQIESDASERYAIEIKKYHAEKELADIEKDSAKHKAKKFSKDGKRVEALKALEDANFNESPPTRNRIIINDATIEKLGELLNENPNGLMLVRDELFGWLSKLSKEEFQGDRAFYLECFDGNGRFKYDRIGRGTIEILNCTLSVIGGIQPSKIRPLLREAINGTTDDGLIQRLQLTVWPDDRSNWVWKDRQPNKQAYINYSNVFFKLHGLNSENKCLRFTPEAQQLFINWRQSIQLIAQSDEICPALESHLLKLPKTIAALALIIELIEGGYETVGAHSTIKALKWADYLKSHAIRLYGVIKNEPLEAAHLILKRKNLLPNPFTCRDIYRKEWAGLAGSDGAKIVNESLEYLIESHHLIPIEALPDEQGGRRTTRYYWNESV